MTYNVFGGTLNLAQLPRNPNPDSSNDLIEYPLTGRG